MQAYQHALEVRTKADLPQDWAATQDNLLLRTRYDIFLSYSRADSEHVKPLLEELRRAGYRVFFDVQRLIPENGGSTAWIAQSELAHAGALLVGTRAALRLHYV